MGAPTRGELLGYLQGRLVYAAGMREVALGKAQLAKFTMSESAGLTAYASEMDLFSMRAREVEMLTCIIEQVTLASLVKGAP